MPDAKKKMLQWLDDTGAPMVTPGTLVVSETTAETFDAHSADGEKHLTAEEKSSLTAAMHSHANAASLDKLVVDADGLKVDGVVVGGGIAIVSSPDETPVYDAKIRLLITEYTPPAEVQNG